MSNELLDNAAKAIRLVKSIWLVDAALDRIRPLIDDAKKRLGFINPSATQMMDMSCKAEKMADARFCCGDVVEEGNLRAWSEAFRSAAESGGSK